MTGMMARKKRPVFEPLPPTRTRSGGLSITEKNSSPTRSSGFFLSARGVVVRKPRRGAAAGEEMLDDRARTAHEVGEEHFWGVAARGSSLNADIEDFITGLVSVSEGRDGGDASTDLEFGAVRTTGKVQRSIGGGSGGEQPCTTVGAPLTWACQFSTPLLGKWLEASQLDFESLGFQ